MNRAVISERVWVLVSMTSSTVYGTMQHRLSDTVAGHGWHRGENKQTHLWPLVVQNKPTSHIRRGNLTTIDSIQVGGLVPQTSLQRKNGGRQKQLAYIRVHLIPDVQNSRLLCPESNTLPQPHPGLHYKHSGIILFDKLTSTTVGIMKRIKPTKIPRFRVLCSPATPPSPFHFPLFIFHTYRAQGRIGSTPVLFTQPQLPSIRQTCFSHKSHSRCPSRWSRRFLPVPWPWITTVNSSVGVAARLHSRYKMAKKRRRRIESSRA